VVAYSFPHYFHDDGDDDEVVDVSSWFWLWLVEEFRKRKRFEAVAAAVERGSNHLVMRDQAPQLSHYWQPPRR